MKVKLVLYFLFLNQFLNAQIDSIEYNLWEQIYDFEILKNEYYFKTWGGETIEKDTIIFDANRFFDNYPSDYSPEYLDSVQFAIASRTLKSFYGENILHNKQNEFIRICWLKENYPVILKFEKLKKANINFALKVGDGNYERHGNILQDTTFYLTERNSKKIHKIIDANTFKNLKNGVICSNNLQLPNVFYFEYKIGVDENIIVISECNLESPAYKEILKLYTIAKTVLEKEKSLTKAYGF